MTLLSRSIRLETTRGPREAIGLVGSIERWHLPMLGTGDDCMPYLALEDGCPTLLLFTSRRKVNRAVTGWIEPSIDTTVRSAQCTREAMATLLSKFAQRGIAWVRINHGPTSVRLPLEAVAGALRQAQQVTASLSTSQLFVLRDPVTPSAPFVEIVHDHPCLRLFTDLHRAQARALAFGPRLVDGPHEAVVALEADDIRALLQRLRGQGVESILLDGPGGGKRMGIDAALRQRIAA